MENDERNFSQGGIPGSDHEGEISRQSNEELGKEQEVRHSPLLSDDDRNLDEADEIEWDPEGLDEE